MFETMASFILVEHADRAIFDPPLGPANYHRAVAPKPPTLQDQDGHISALVYNDKHRNKFIDAVTPAWATEEFATLEQRARQINTVYGLLAETFTERTTEEWLTLFRALGIPAAPLRKPEELFDNEHLNAVDFFERVQSPAGTVRFPGVPAWFSRTPGRVHGPAPTLGGSREDIVAEFGLSRSQSRSETSTDA